MRCFCRPLRNGGIKIMYANRWFPGKKIQRREPRTNKTKIEDKRNSSKQKYERNSREASDVADDGYACSKDVITMGSNLFLLSFFSDVLVSSDNTNTRPIDRLDTMAYAWVSVCSLSLGSAPILRAVLPIYERFANFVASIIDSSRLVTACNSLSLALVPSFVRLLCLLHTRSWQFIMSVEWRTKCLIRTFGCGREKKHQFPTHSIQALVQWFSFCPLDYSSCFCVFSACLGSTV